MSTDQPKKYCALYIFVDLWYNKCKENHENQAKSLHMEGTGMYRYSNGQWNDIIKVESTNTQKSDIIILPQSEEKTQKAGKRNVDLQ